MVQWEKETGGLFMLLPAEAHAEIEKLHKDSHHVELTIGIRQDKQTEIIHLDPRQQEDGKSGGLPCHGGHGD